MHELSIAQSVVDAVCRRAGIIHCHRCDADAVIDDLILLCPCGSADVYVTAGPRAADRLDRGGLSRVRDLWMRKARPPSPRQ